MNLKRDGYWLLAALVFGLCVLPLLVYTMGTVVLGPYSKGGLAAFLGSYVSDLARLRWSAWALALGPLTVVAFWRVLVRLFGIARPA